MEQHTDTIEDRVLQALDEIRPFLQSDGGDIELVEIKLTTVLVRLLGSCVGCSVNQMTLKIGVESAIKKHVPEIQTVTAVD